MVGLRCYQLSKFDSPLCNPRYSEAGVAMMPTEMLKLLRLLCEKLDVAIDGVASCKALEERVHPEELLRQIEHTGAGEKAAPNLMKNKSL
jgi:hypothetical protein